MKQLGLHAAGRFGFELRIGGEGPEVDRLEWDVKLYLALNGGKQSVALDYTESEGTDLLFRLIDSSDIIVSNLNAATVEYLGAHRNEGPQILVGDVVVVNNDFVPAPLKSVLARTCGPRDPHALGRVVEQRRGDDPRDLELQPVGVLGVEALRRRVVAGADEGARLGEPLLEHAELGQRPDLPRQVVEPDGAPAGG